MWQVILVILLTPTTLQDVQHSSRCGNHHYPFFLRNIPHILGETHSLNQDGLQSPAFHYHKGHFDHLSTSYLLREIIRIVMSMLPDIFSRMVSVAPGFVLVIFHIHWNASLIFRKYMWRCATTPIP